MNRRRAILCRAIVATAPLVLTMAACSRSDESAAAAASPAVTVSATDLGLGRPAMAQEIAALDLDVNPAGVGLPPGQATAVSGAPVYAAKCARCHGAKGEGIAPSPAIVGRIPGDSFPFGNDPKLAKTVGNYWPYATTIYDYVRRTMPIDAPGSLTPAEIYAVVAVVLADNGITEPTTVIDATTLPKIRMPARDRFVPDDRKGTTVR
jgi:cytochrome c